MKIDKQKVYAEVVASLYCEETQDGDSRVSLTVPELEYLKRLIEEDVKHTGRVRE